MVGALSNGDIADNIVWPLSAQTTRISTFCTITHIFVMAVDRNFNFNL